MAGLGLYLLYKNDGTNTYIDYNSIILPEINNIEVGKTEDIYDWSREGYNFIGWNTSADGTGTNYQPGDSPPSSIENFYAIWEEQQQELITQKFYNESDIRAIASAIRAKNGLSSTYTVSQMASAIQNIPSGGVDTTIEDELVTKTLSTYENSRVTALVSYAFYRYPDLISVSFPEATIIHNNAFQHCSSLVTINAPKVTAIEDSAFWNCNSFRTASFPEVTTIGSFVFYNCIRLSIAILPKATTLGNCAFQLCSRLTDITLGGEQSTTGLLYSSCFYKCSRLISLYLEGSYSYVLSHSNAFESTPIGGYTNVAGGYGSIYVPPGLYSQYISATNWVYFSSRFAGSAGGGSN